MQRVVALIASLIVVGAFAGTPTHTSVDLRAPQALGRLQKDNPAHFRKIQELLAGLADEPKLAEGEWLQVTFGVRDVDLSKHLLRTSNPPKQLLRFTLDDVRYTMYVVRSDLTAQVAPADPQRPRKSSPR